MIWLSELQQVNPRRKLRERVRGVTPIAPKTGMRILWGEGGVLPCVGVSEWVVSGNEGLTEEGVFVVFCLCMFVCLVYMTGES